MPTYLVRLVNGVVVEKVPVCVIQKLLASGEYDYRTGFWDEESKQWKSVTLLLDAPTQVAVSSSGAAAPSAEAKVEVNPHRDIPIPQPSSEPKGVGGWLLVLCIWLTIISPLFSFAKLHELNQTEMNLGLGLIVFSVISGVFLWCGKPVGVVLVRIQLSIILILNLIGVMLLANQQQSERVVVVLFQSAVPVAWLAYLSVSKRVKATYHE